MFIDEFLRSGQFRSFRSLSFSLFAFCFFMDSFVFERMETACVLDRTNHSSGPLKNRKRIRSIFAAAASSSSSSSYSSFFDRPRLVRFIMKDVVVCVDCQKALDWAHLHRDSLRYWLCSALCSALEL